MRDTFGETRNLHCLIRHSESFLSDSDSVNTYGIQKELKIEFDGLLKVIFRPDSPMRDERAIFSTFLQSQHSIHTCKFV